jgi:hypothetical protein
MHVSVKWIDKYTGCRVTTRRKRGSIHSNDEGNKKKKKKKKTKTKDVYGRT